MPSIKYKDKSYHCQDNETILQAFLRHGVQIPFSCKNGICHVCLMRSEIGNIPENSYSGLKQNLINNNYFKACCCVPTSDMEIEDPKAADMLTYGVIAKKEMLSADVCRFLIEPATNIYYHSGQFINLRREDGEMRSYSLSSVPSEDYYLEIQVKKVDNGLFSHWMFDTLSENDEIQFQGPNGHSYYSSDTARQPLLLIGTGTGLSPLIGIARDALLNGHEGEIHLYHGSHSQEGLYLDKQLRELEFKYPQFHYNACVSGAQESIFLSGRANDIAMSNHPDLKGWQVFLCGQPDMVSTTEKLVEQAGADPKDIKTDPFWQSTSDPSFEKKERRHYPPPNPEMWKALEEGKVLTKILNDFYTRVYDDPKLSSFFENTTKQRSIEKQYSFLYQVFTGEKVYFGDRPRNAHHWMVISNELFDYRAALMEKCIRAQGLPEKMITQWLEMENGYRKEMVKDKPWNLIKFGKEIPMDGYEELKMDSATLCDHCQAEINIGDTVRYHVRIGKIYCQQCMKH